MSKKLHSKLLSVVLVIAICCTTVFGCLINASALTYNGTYTFSGGEAAYGATSASIDVTFNLSEGLAAGEFAIPNGNALNASNAVNASDVYAGVSVKVKSGIINGSTVVPDDLSVECFDDTDGDYLAYIQFYSQENGGDLSVYTSLTFELTYTFNYTLNGNNYDCVLAGNKYTVDIVPILFSTIYGDEIDVQMTGSASYIHTHVQTWAGSAPDFSSLGDNQFATLQTKCQICGDKHSYTQIYPDYSKVPNAKATATAGSASGNLGISGMTINYNNDGTVNVNIHAFTPYYSGGYYLVVCDTDGNIKYQVPNSKKTTSYLATKGILTANAHQFTLENLSAKDINQELLFTMVHDDGSNIQFSTTFSASIADYCVNVVEGNAVWTEDATAEQIEADKDVAAALYYYGAKVNDYFNNPVNDNTGSDDSNSTDIYDGVELVEKTIDKWEYKSELSASNLGWGFYQKDFNAQYPEQDASTYGTKANPYLVENAEQLAYLALGDKTNASNFDTTGLYFKVKDGIDAFYMSPGIDGTETLDEVKSYASGITQNPNGAYYDADGKRVVYWQHSNNNCAFNGHFDGNGVTIYGIISNGTGNSGLFPIVTSDFSVENVTVANSYISAVTVVGAIVGQINTGNYAMSFDNCTVKNNYLATTTTAATGWNQAPAGLCGGGQTPSSLKINNCLVYGNEMYSALNENCTAFIAYAGLDDTKCNSDDYLISNSVAIGHAPWVGNAGYAVRTNGNLYKNVYTNIGKGTGWQDGTTVGDTSIKSYTDATQMQGSNATANLSLNFDDIWLATESYPELRVFHELTTVSLGQEGHKEICITCVGDTKCGLTGLTKEHELDINGDAVQCSCGYNEKIDVSNIPVEKSIDTWNWTSGLPDTAPYYNYGDPDGIKLLDESKENSESNPYIIETAEQLAAIALWGGDSTAGKYYRVADGIDRFYLTPYTHTYDATSYDTLKASLSVTKDPINTNTNVKRWQSNSNYAFQGHFDGNGVTICGMSTSGNEQAALFPFVKGDISFKNIKITESHISATSQAGAIVGKTTDWSDISNISFENIVVTGNYMEMTNTTANANDGYRELGGLAGSLSCPTGKVSINNCIVINNKTDVANGDPYYGFISHLAQRDITYSFSNSITDGIPWMNKAYYINRETNYSNIYSTVASIDSTVDNHDSFTPSESQLRLVTDAGLKGTASTNLSLKFDDIWLATSGYPELRVFHELAVAPNGAAGHKEVCRVTVNGVKCTVCGLEEDHTLVPNGDNTLEECSECIFSKEIISGTLTDISPVITERLNSNTTFATKFASSSLFKAAYAADVNPTDWTSDCYMYASSLNVKANPYIAFTFAFRGDYAKAENKPSVNATFKVNGATIATATAADMINNTGAGRYHLYRLTAIPVTQMCKPVSVSVSYGGNTIDMGSYSAAGYAINAMNAGSAYVYHANAAMSIVFYSEMLAARYGA